MTSEKFDRGYFTELDLEKSSREWQLFYREQISEIKRHCGNRIKICDVGCGLGDFLKICDELGWATYGMDIAEYAISEAKKGTKAELKVGDIQKVFPFELKFDLITCFDVLEHLGHPEAALINIRNGLKDSGVLLVTTPNLKSHVYTRFLNWQKDETHISLKQPKEWARLLGETGFRIKWLKTGFPLLSKRGGIKSFVGKVLSRLGLGSTLYILAEKQARR